MDLMIRISSLHDLEYLKEHDEYHIRDHVSHLIDNQEYFVAEQNSQNIGFLRYSMFWRSIPYMEMIRINEQMRGHGVGTKLFQFWEKEMKKKKVLGLMTSATSDEYEPQNFHKKMGFEVCGLIDFHLAQTVPEKFFLKTF